MAVDHEKWVQVHNGTLAVWDGIGYKALIINGNEYNLALQQGILREMLRVFKYVVEKDARDASEQNQKNT